MSIIETFKNQPLIIQIADIAFIISLIYEIITGKGINISLWILGLTIILDLFLSFFKKEE